MFLMNQCTNTWGVKSTWKQQNPWITNGILNLINQKKFFSKILKSNKYFFLWEIQILQRQTKSRNQKKEKDYYNNFFDKNTKNMK